MPDHAPPPDDRELVALAAAIDGCDDSHRRLLAHLDELGACDPAQPSLLPVWTLGHVLTHIARNADGVLRMLDGLAQYWYGATSRNADIALGATRTWDELVADVAETGAAAIARMRATTDWTGIARSAIADRPKSVLPTLRRREVEIHRIDLGLGYGFDDLPTEYVRSELATLQRTWQARQPMGLTGLPDAVRQLAEPSRLAWFLGRRAIDGVDPAGIY